MTTELPKINPAGVFEVSEAARILGVHRSSLYRRISRGDIESFVRKGDGRRCCKGTAIIRFFNEPAETQEPPRRRGRKTETITETAWKD